MTETLKVQCVIGTGAPMDSIMLVPLLVDWKVPEGCIGGVMDGAECTKAAARIYVLAEPFQGHTTVRVCREHHAVLLAKETAQ